MKTNVATTTLGAVLCLLCARASAALPQAAARPGPTGGTQLGTALLTPIAQNRFVDAFAGGATCPFSGDSYAAPDFGPFSALVAAGSSCGWAQADQSSSILDDGIVASGNAFAWCAFCDVGDVAIATSYVYVKFSVASPVSYRATGSADGAWIELRDDNGALFGVSYGTVDELGLLAPGEYELSISASDYGSYDLTLDLDPCDTTPPMLSCPSIVSVVDEKGGPPGELAFFSVTALDGCDPAPSVVCTPPSGSFFPRGTTMVTCTATDASGNQSVATFPVVVMPTVRRR